MPRPSKPTRPAAVRRPRAPSSGQTGPAAAPATDVDGRRHELVAAACALIAERGFEGLRTREVAARVGVNQATLHYYFPTKEALIGAVVRALVARLDTVRLIPEYAGLPAREALHAHFAAAAGQMREEPDVFIALDECFLRAGRDPALAPVVAQADQAWTTFLAELLARGVAEGAFRADLDTPAAARVFVTVFKGYALPLEPGDDALERVVAQLEAWVAAPVRDTAPEGAESGRARNDRPARVRP